MELDFRRKETSVGIVIISAACCIPGMAPLDEQARRIVEQAISETGIMAQVKIMPATTAFFGGVSKQIMAELMNMSQSAQLPVPAILINGKPISYGIPELENIKSALLTLATTNPK
ncbi:MAG: hypothetical protein A2X25_09445 [Chloroflexi bacterium GWB2_49_20]|nr:MAG: hypothetical protein A2X25_09445 [Chloroflexi bacterium GWB2_49_20]OGN79352.1 MAG: hypothetical protein A2X26_04580 [Chloroflexi bacterium GWC2_49_37]OGN82878.1 MAG: hypothetical protein A2X27_08115 [Chloroflexi bacterium GWD2_49_16]HCC78531.1 hypothetical protein [Anaerolineae bacterium]